MSSLISLPRHAVRFGGGLGGESSSESLEEDGNVCGCSKGSVAFCTTAFGGWRTAGTTIDDDDELLEGMRTGSVPRRPLACGGGACVEATGANVSPTASVRMAAATGVEFTAAAGALGGGSI